MRLDKRLIGFLERLLKKVKRSRKLLRSLRRIRTIKRLLRIRSVSTTLIRDEEIWLVDIASKTAKTDSGRIIQMDPEIWNKYKKKDKIVRYEVQTGLGITRSGKKVSLIVNPRKIPDFVVAPSGNVYDMRQQGNPSYSSSSQCLEDLDEPMETLDSDYSEAENFQRHGRMPVFKPSSSIRCTGLISSEGASGLGKILWGITNGIRWLYRGGSYIIHTAGYYIERPFIGE